MDFFFSILLILAIVGLVAWAFVTYALPLL